MYSIVIADGEEREAQEIKACIRSAGLKLAVTGVANTGPMAVRLVLEIKPDIVIISVNLRGLSGLKVAEYLREWNPELRIILTSPYQSIDFIKSGLVLGISDYLSKPLNEGILVPALLKAMGELARLQKNAEEEAAQKELLGRFRELAEQNFLYTALYGGKEGSLEEQRKLLGLGTQGFIFNIEMPVPGWKRRGRFTPCYETVKETISEYGLCAVGPQTMDRLIVYVDAQEDSEKADAEEIKEIAQTLRKRLKRDTESDILIGIGSIRPVEAIHESYEEAVLCLRYRSNSPVVHIREIGPQKIDKGKYWELENRLLEGIRFGKEDSIHSFAGLLELLLPLSTEELKNKILEILTLANHKAIEAEQDAGRSIDFRRYLNDLDALKPEEIRPWAFRRLGIALRSIRAGRGAKRSAAVKQALRYIGDHYRSGITLEEVSAYVGVTPQHFSKQFKEETGTNFMDYVTRLRMQAAQEYLKENELTVKEISYLVGYHDPNYFSRVFKKTVGVSPTEFINNNN